MEISALCARAAQAIIQEQNAGRRKRQLALSVAREFAKRHASNPDVVVTTINTIGPRAMDVTVAIARGAIDIGKGMRTCCKCTSCLIM